MMIEVNGHDGFLYVNTDQISRIYQKDQADPKIGVVVMADGSELRLYGKYIEKLLIETNARRA